jgi:hypothetical protein
MNYEKVESSSTPIIVYGANKEKSGKIGLSN